MTLPSEDSIIFLNNFTNALLVISERTNEKFFDVDFNAPADEVYEIAKLSRIVTETLDEFIYPKDDKLVKIVDLYILTLKIRNAVPDIETDPIRLQFTITESEIKAFYNVFSVGFDILSGSENLSDQTANKAIHFDNFRRRILNAAGFDDTNFAGSKSS
jgi:hypothetical protein